MVFASEAPPSAGFARSLQGRLLESCPGLPTRVVGARDVPAMPQELGLEAAVALDAAQIARAAWSVMRQAEA